MFFKYATSGRVKDTSETANHYGGQADDEEAKSGRSYWQASINAMPTSFLTPTPHSHQLHRQATGQEAGVNTVIFMVNSSLLRSRLAR